MLSYTEMVEKTKDFYESIEVKIPEDRIELAVASLTMPQYAETFKNETGNNIIDHRGIATVGDAICGALLMMKEYFFGATMKKMTDEKVAVRNDRLNDLGRKLLEGHLFFANNDLDSINKKSYATAFEAVIGFLSFIDLNKAKSVFDQFIK